MGSAVDFPASLSRVLRLDRAQPLPRDEVVQIHKTSLSSTIDEQPAVLGVRQEESLEITFLPLLWLGVLPFLLLRSRRSPLVHLPADPN